MTIYDINKIYSALIGENDIVNESYLLLVKNVYGDIVCECPER